MKLKDLVKSFRKRKISHAENVFLSCVKKHFTKSFRRNYKYQAIIGNMIVDFWFKLKAVIVEIDGPEHDKDRDERRDAFLASHGLTTLRFTNNQVIKDPYSIFKLVMSYPDKFDHHAKASGSIYKLLAFNKTKVTRYI